MDQIITNFLFLPLLSTAYYSSSFSKNAMAEYRGERMSSLIIGGLKAESKQFPYAVSIQEYDKYFQTYEHVCTFSLITTKSVLGAAHCVIGPRNKIQDVENYIGVFGTMNHLDRTNNETFDEFRVHPDYNNDYLFNDIAILVFSEPIKTGNLIKPIPLIGRGLSFIGRRGIMFGWGITRPSSTRSPRMLRYVDIDIVDGEICEDYYGFLDKGQFCFGTEQRGGCDGDSGAPVIVKFKRKNVQMGIFSFNGEPCARQPSTGINISFYTLWIRYNAVGRPMFVN